MFLDMNGNLMCGKNLHIHTFMGTQTHIQTQI